MVLEAWRCERECHDCSLFLDDGAGQGTAGEEGTWERKGAGAERVHPGEAGRRGLLLPQLRDVRQRQFLYLQSGVQISKGGLLIRLDKIYKASGHI